VNSTTCKATDGTEVHGKQWLTSKRIVEQIAVSLFRSILEIQTMSDQRPDEERIEDRQTA
jgi:hypothetical protein